MKAARIREKPRVRLIESSCPSSKTAGIAGTPATPDDPLFRRCLLRVAEIAVKISEGVPVDLAAAE